MIGHRARAREVNSILRSLAAAGPLRVGFPSAFRAAEAYDLLRGHGFRKPWLTRRKEWTRAVILEPAVYDVVWPHVELEFVIDGSTRFFSGSGHRRRANPNLATLEAQLPPILWIIDLGSNYPLFAQVLDLELRPVNQ